MSDTTFRILITVLTVILVGWMVADQRRLKQMTHKKWGIAALLLVVLIGNTWMGATS